MTKPQVGQLWELSSYEYVTILLLEVGKPYNNDGFVKYPVFCYRVNNREGKYQLDKFDMAPSFWHLL